MRLPYYGRRIIFGIAQLFLICQKVQKYGKKEQ